MSKLNIAVVGAGIGGMSCALGLSRNGFNVTVFEQAPELSEVGAGLTITPNATKGLNYLNLSHWDILILHQWVNGPLPIIVILMKSI